MANHRRYQNIRIPDHLRPTRQRTSVSRTVRNIQPLADPRYAEIGTAVVYHRECLVATAGGKYWVIVEAQSNVQST